MKLIDSSIKYPVTVAVGVLLAVFGGLIAVGGVPIQLTPDVQRPYITVTTNWFGASPAEVEKEIIEEQEKYLKSVEGALEMTSESHDGYGSITMEFAPGTDVTGAVVKVTNKLNEVPNYPDDADRPVVTSSSPFENIIGWFVVKSQNDSIYVPHEFTMVEELVQPRLERVDGVAKVNIFGGLEEELHVTFRPELLASSGITISEFTNALIRENRDISGGDFSEGKRRYVVRTISRFDSINDVENTIIKVVNGASVRIKDVADVKQLYRKPVALVRHFGSPSIALAAQRQVGANVLEVTEALLAQVDIINKEVLNPRGLYIKNVYNQTSYINSAIDLVFNNIYLGSFLAILVLFLFLRSFSSILVIGISIPISVITTFLTMSIFGRSINVVSLAGMAFAVGMVVDNSIVVLENIYRHMQMGKPRFQAAVDGSKEVWGAVLASTTTTIAVFLPIMFVQEHAAQLFRDIAIAISSAIAVSLIVAMTVIPAMSARILKTSVKLHGDESEKSFLAVLARRVASFVDYINASGMRRLSTILGIVVVSLGLSWLLLPDSEYLPNGNQNFLFGFMLPPPGYNIEEMVSVAEDVESRISHLWLEDGGIVDTLPGGGIDNFFFVAFPNQAFMGMRSADESRAKELIPMANGVLFSIPGAIGFVNQSSLFSGGFSSTRSIQIDVTGPDLEKVLEIAGQVFQQVPAVLPNSGARPIPALDLGNPEVRIYPDRRRAADAGFTAREIGAAVNALVDGARISDYRFQGREIDLVIKGTADWTKYTQSIEQLPLATPSGQIISLGDIATIEQRQGPVQINHVERQRAISVLVNLPDNIALERGMELIDEQITGPMREQGLIGGLYDIKLSGAADDLTKLRKALSSNFMVAILLTYLLLAALFQSFTYPLVILLTVPLATFGGVVGLDIVQFFNPNQKLDVLTMLGFVILVGTVVNNSILIVHYALQLMREGWDPRSAVKESVRVRVRPIFMSTGTSNLGMLPLVIMPGAGSELYRGLGSVVVGGLAFSAIFTLVLTPLVFSYAIEATIWVKGLFGMEKVAASSAPSIDQADSATEF